MKVFVQIILMTCLVALFSGCGESSAENDSREVYRQIPLVSSVNNVQPMTGIVLWNSSEHSSSDAIQLEFSYLRYDDVAVAKDPQNWDWSGVESLLDDIASHKHQAILRFYYAYPGESTSVPAYIKALANYSETSGLSEGEMTDFPDWSNEELQRFSKEFYAQFAQRYDQDPRIAFLQVGFGLWSEYHIYDPGENLGENFPSKGFQTEFLMHMDSLFTELQWSISIDAADEANTPFESNPALVELGFGLFDDSFLQMDHDEYNKSSFEFFGYEKRMLHPVGGEINYYTDQDQAQGLAAEGPHGVSYEEMAATYNVSYMIGNDQPEYQSMERIRKAGIASGYRFEIIAFEGADEKTTVEVKNVGIAPFYYDAFVAVDGVRAQGSLKGLQPGDSEQFTIDISVENPTLSIESDRLVEGQVIEFDASLE